MSELRKVSDMSIADLQERFKGFDRDELLLIIQAREIAIEVRNEAIKGLNDELKLERRYNGRF